MTFVGWLAVCGPLAAGILGFGVGFGMGVRQRADEVGQLRSELSKLAGQVATARRDVEALAAAPLSRAQSGRVLDLVTPGAS